MRHNKFSAVLFLFASVFGFLALAGEAGAAETLTRTYSRNSEFSLGFSLPRQIYFTEQNRWDAAEARSPKDLNLTLGGDHGSQVLYVYVEDTNRDGVIDAGDYSSEITYRKSFDVEVTFPESMQPLFDADPLFCWTEDMLRAVSEDLWQRLDSIFKQMVEEEEKIAKKDYRILSSVTHGGTDPDAIDAVVTLGVDEYGYHRRWGQVKVTPVQQGGSDSSLYIEQFATLRLRLGVLLPAETDETELSETRSWPVTQLVNFTIRPFDQGGNNGDNGGGSCGVFGLGVALLPVPAVALLRRKRS